MATRYVMGLDAGSEGCRCLICDLKGIVTAFKSRPWDYYTPPGLEPLGREFYPGVFWSTMSDTMREAIAAAGIAPTDILAVAAASQREAVVFLDSEGAELYAGPNVDLRALMEGLSLEEELGDELYRITGHRPYFMLTPAKLRWFRRHRPRDYERIAHVLPLDGWIAYRLSGEAAAAVSSAGEIGLLDVAQGAWSQRLMELQDLPLSVYPPLGQAGATVGRVTARAARETGLPPGTPVVLAGADTQCGLLGMGVKDEGQGGILAGWSATLQVPVARPVFDGQSRTWTGCHVFPGRWVLEGNAGEAGSIYRWLKEILFPQHLDNGYAALETEAGKAPLGAESTLALLGPQLIDMSKAGMKMGGFFFPVPRILVQVGRGHLTRAFLENLAFALRANGDRLEAVSGLKIHDFRLGGGFSLGSLFPHILAQVLEKPVKAPAFPHATPLGAAMAAAAAATSSSLEDAASAMLPPFRTYEPDPTDAADYQDCYQRWLLLARAMDDLSQEVL